MFNCGLITWFTCLTVTQASERELQLRFRSQIVSIVHSWQC
uniref:Uncharacterized protein n=1 Tax=Setaria viridis TaxID=4556 RepID=A0A4U6UEP2_SETVI|nr:hypothetical protein SEVIR_5G176750v2 [Setaria viridis]